MISRVLLFLLLATAAADQAPKKVAIVGGGIGGAATAHFLSEMLPSARIEVFEAGQRAGGRAHTLDANLFGVPLDAGATSIFSKNKYLVSLIERFGLRKADDHGGKQVIGLWDGSGFRFRWTESSLLLPVHIVARYGPSPLRLIEAVDSAVQRLLGVYDLQARNVSFGSPEELFDALQLTELTQRSAESYFVHTLGVSKQFVDEFVTGASRDNYNQDSRINAFVDLVSLAGAGIGGSVFYLANGTTPLVEALLSSSPAIVTHTSSRVAAISVVTRTHDDEEAGEEGEGLGRKSVKRGGGLGARSGAAGARGADRTYHQFEISLARLGASARAFDAVVLATPLEASHGLKLHGAPKQLNATRPYQRTCVTFVSGIVNPSYFGVLPLSTVQQDEDQARLDEDPVPTDILTVENSAIPFSTLALHARLANGTRVYKLFSREPLSEALLTSMFRQRHKTVRLDWAAAYPNLEPTPPAATWPKFEVPLEPLQEPVDAADARAAAVTADEEDAARGERGGAHGAHEPRAVRRPTERRAPPPLIYVNAMESGVSCMETQLIAAKNAALRVARLLES